MTRITDEQLDQLEELANAATPGPWEWVGCQLESRDATILTENTSDNFYGEEMLATDAAHIAAAHPATILKLIERLRFLEREYERLQNK